MSDEKHTRKGKTDPAKGGRPSFLDDTDRIEKMLDYIKAGNFPQVAVRAAGLGRRSFYDYMKRGREDDAADRDTPERAFFNRVEEAEEEGEALLVGRVRLASTSPKAWSAAAWLLERRFPDRWGQNTKVTLLVQQELEAVVAKLEKGLGKDEFRRVLEILADGTPGAPTTGEPQGG